AGGRRNRGARALAVVGNAVEGHVDGVGPTRVVGEVLAGPAVDHVVTVGGRALDERVVAGVAVQRVVAGGAVDRVVAGAAGQDVVQRVAGDRVGEVRPDRVLDVGEGVVAHAGPGRGREVHDHRTARAGVVDRVLAGPTLEVVVPVAADEVVVTVAAVHREVGAKRGNARRDILLGEDRRGGRDDWVVTREGGSTGVEAVVAVAAVQHDVLGVVDAQVGNAAAVLVADEDSTRRAGQTLAIVSTGVGDRRGGQRAVLHDEGVRAVAQVNRRAGVGRSGPVLWVEHRERLGPGVAAGHVDPQHGALDRRRAAGDERSVVHGDVELPQRPGERRGPGGVQGENDVVVRADVDVQRVVGRDRGSPGTRRCCRGRDRRDHQPYEEGSGHDRRCRGDR